jgi:ABC-2 type transport system permease protein
MRDVTRKRLKNIIFKEWRLLFTDFNSAFLMTLVPLLIVLQGMLYVWLAYKFGGEKMLTVPVFRTALRNIVSEMPGTGQLAADKQLLVLLLNQFNFFLLLIPTMIAVSAATFSIVDEKLTGSLEALLATPVRTWELLLGKALAGAITALIFTWVAAGVFLLVTSLLGWGDYFKFVVTAGWFLTIFLVTPAVAMLSFILGVMGSSRARDAKSAQNMVLIIIFPVFALIGVQVTGLVWFTPLLMLVLALGILMIDALMLRFAVSLFRRESVLVQWH